MHFNNDQEKAVLAAVKNYRTWIYQLLKDSKDELSADSNMYFSDMFTVLSESQKMLQDAVDNHQLGDDLDYDDEPNDLDDEIGKENGIEKSWPPRAEARVLICDDDELSIELLGIMLENIGFDAIHVATGGKEAISKILESEEPYDLIICDWKMPDITGLDVHKQAQGESKLNDTYFILLTAIEDDVLKSRSLKQGINDYLVKPIEDKDLEAKLNTIFGS